MGLLRNGYIAGLCLLFLGFNGTILAAAEPTSLAEALDGLPDCAVSCAFRFPLSHLMPHT